jgi:DNA-binding MarR family transcriptional regulator
MRNDILDRVSKDLLSILPLMIRGVRKKLYKIAFSDKDVSITHHHFAIMKMLAEARTLHITEIGKRLQIAKAQMTYLIDKLVDLNLVERQFNASDRRAINVVLTDKGRIILEQHDLSLRNAVKEILSSLTDEELKDLSASLKKLRDIFSKL